MDNRNINGAADDNPPVKVISNLDYTSFSDLNTRSREIFRQIVEMYLETGEPVGSRNISKFLPMSLSPASVRNVMTDLEELGLISSPHTSAGRMPTNMGLRFFVDSFLEVSGLSNEEQAEIAAQVRAASGRAVPGGKPNYEDILAEASSLLSGLSRGAGVVLTSKGNQHLS
ncbi:MAG: hypothetical protein K8F25_04045, partial [Fimbriimonadaceae bacterium]|nr:hypothetical protein [Alphaproteobacteria bacterium]